MERLARRGGPAAVTASRSPATARGRLPPAQRLRHRAGRRRRRRDDHELQRADVLLRRRAVHPGRHRLERLRRDRRRHLGRHQVPAAALPEPGPAEQRDRAVLDRPQPAGRRRRSASATLTDGTDRTGSSSTAGHVKNFGERDHAHGRDLDADLGATACPATRSRSRTAATISLRQRRTPAWAIRAPASTGVPRTATARAVRTSPCGAGERHASTPSPRPRRCRRVGDDHVRRLEQAGGHVQDRREHDVRRHARHHSGGEDAHRNR